MRSRLSLTGARLAFGMWVATSAFAAPFSFTTGNPDGLMGAVSRRASPGKLETETADRLYAGPDHGHSPGHNCRVSAVGNATAGYQGS